MEQGHLFAPGVLVPTGPAFDHGYTGRWRIGICHPGAGWGGKDEEPALDCQPTILSKDLRCNCWPNFGGSSMDFPGCECIGDLMYRGACTHCEWEAPLMRSSEHLAVSDALDHSWPTWRNLPVDPGPIPEGSSPKDSARVQAWIKRLVTIGYPEGWIEAGGPIRARRQQGGTRPHTVHTGFDNYSITGEVMGCATSIGMARCDGIEHCLTGRCTPFDINTEDED